LISKRIELLEEFVHTKAMKYVVCFLMCLGLIGCQSSPSSLEQWRIPSRNIKVLCTTPIIDDLVARIGGERIDHLSLMDRSIDPHSYELVKGDDEKFLVAQVIFYNGLGLEHSASLKAQLQNHSRAIALGEEIRRQDPSLILQDRGQADPHIWLDVSLWKNAVDPIVFHLTATDPAGAAYYEAQGSQVKKELIDLDQWMQDKFATIPSEKKYLVTSHDAFSYFARRYLQQEGVWKDRFCAPEGLAPDGQLGFQDLERVINYLQKNQIQILFSESNISQDSLKKIVDICREKKWKVQISPHSLFSDTLSDSESNTFTYKEMMQHNVMVLHEAWGPQ
jgi:manganese/zinc/iron transport system substrate-binding protein